MASYVLHLAGPVRLIDKGGADRTPNAAKARGLLAIMAVSVDHRIARARAMDLLWSDRGPEQAAASLRQALSAIRACAGAEVLRRGNGWIALDVERVRVALAPPSGGAAPPEFAADLDIRDAEFEHWIRDRRAEFAARWTVTSSDPAKPIEPATSIVPGDPAAADKATAGALAAPPAAAPATSDGLSLVVGRATSDDPGLALQGDMLLTEAVLRAADLSACHVVARPPADTGDATGTGALAGCRLARNDGRVMLQVELVLLPEGLPAWAQGFSGPEDRLPDLLAQASAALTAALIHECAAERHPGRDRLPLADIFSFDATRLERADRLLADRHARRPSGGLLALRAFLRHTLLLERLDPDRGRLLDEADEMARRALQIAPHSSLVLALTSLVAGLRTDDELALDLARRAVEVDPLDAMARQCASVAWSFAGRPVEAHREARLARGSRLATLAQPLFDLRTAYTSIGLGDRDGALRLARTAVQAAPDFRAALRVVAALEYAAGHEDRASDCLSRLRALEPDFSLDLMGSDAYPVDSLRAAGLLRITRSGLI